MNFESILASALTASLVSAIVIIANSYFDRKSRRKELLMNLAYKLAKERTDLVLKIAMEQNQPAQFQDLLVLMGGYYQWLSDLDSKGKLSQEALEKMNRKK
jgi:hypothetical protein